MKIYDLRDKEGRIFAFEIENLLLTRCGFCKIVKTIPGIKIKKSPRFFSWGREDEFCEFELDGHTFVSWEPFGDNDRYWVGPKSHVWCPPIDQVRTAFLRHKLLFGLIS